MVLHVFSRIRENILLTITFREILRTRTLTGNVLILRKGKERSLQRFAAKVSRGGTRG